MKHVIKTGIFGLLTSVLVLTLACAGPQAARPFPEEVIARSQAAMGQARSYRYETSTVLTRDGRTELSSEQGELVAPDRYHVLSTGKDGTSDTISIGDDVYTRAAGASVWNIRRPSPGVVWSSQEIRLDWSQAFGSLVGLTELADEKIDGVECYHYRGEIDMKARADEAISNMPELDPADPNYASVRRSMEAAVESMRNTTSTVEFWLARGDYLARKVKSDVESVTPAGTDMTTAPINQVISNTYRYFDFNADIIIEPPQNVERVNLIANGLSVVGGDDIGRQRVDYRITVTNQGSETAKDVKLFVDTATTGQGMQTIEWVPDHEAVSLAPSQSANFTASWEIDLTTTGKQGFVELMMQDVVRATWTGDDGGPREKVLMRGGMPAMW